MAEEHGIQLNQAKRLSDLPTQNSENGRPNVVIVWHTKLNDMEYADLLRVSRRATIVVALPDKPGSYSARSGAVTALRYQLIPAAGVRR